MAKTKKKTTRRYYRRFRRFKPVNTYANFKCEYTCILWKKNIVPSGSTTEQGVGYRFYRQGQLDNYGINMTDFFSGSWTDFVKFKEIYNEFRIRGLAIQLTPHARNACVDSMSEKDNVIIGLDFTQAVTASQVINGGANTLVCNPLQFFNKYFKNVDYSWFQTDVHAVTATSNEKALQGNIVVCPYESSTVVQSKCPSWTVKFILYLSFRSPKY